MKKIIPFTKELKFVNNIYEITSISLEHNFVANDNEIKGEFIINGDYTKSIIDDKEPFIFNIPFNAIIDYDFDKDKIKVDIDDFNYNIKDDNILEVNINLLIDNIVKKEEKIEVLEEPVLEIKDDREEVTSIFDNFDDKDDKYVTYNVHIYREDDDINKILNKYKVTKEELSNYNDLEKITIGSKIIIPSNE
ncbi:MAG: hypothetical protein IKE73_01225 [Bacilli bacterium]|nr:hypothetical protein [Bacilli bacterium]